MDDQKGLTDDGFGIQNAMVVSETPAKLRENWGSFFDKIIIDAPCSGEGMFRKDDNAVKSWEKYDVEYFCEIQREILSDAGKMLKAGGMMSSRESFPVDDLLAGSDFDSGIQEGEVLHLSHFNSAKKTKTEVRTESWSSPPKYQNTNK